MTEYTTDELKILLCVAKCRQRIGRNLLIEVLRASHSVRVFSRRLYLQSTFGILREHTAEDLDRMISGLIDRGLLEETTDEYPRLMLTEESKKLLHEHEEEILPEAEQ